MYFTYSISSTFPHLLYFLYITSLPLFSLAFSLLPHSPVGSFFPSTISPSLYIPSLHLHSLTLYMYVLTSSTLHHYLYMNSLSPSTLTPSLYTPSIPLHCLNPSFPPPYSLTHCINTLYQLQQPFCHTFYYTLWLHY